MITEDFPIYIDQMINNRYYLSFCFIRAPLQNYAYKIRIYCIDIRDSISLFLSRIQILKSKLIFFINSLTLFTNSVRSWECNTCCIRHYSAQGTFTGNVKFHKTRWCSTFLQFCQDNWMVITAIRIAEDASLR